MGILGRVTLTERLDCFRGLLRTWSGTYTFSDLIVYCELVYLPGKVCHLFLSLPVFNAITGDYEASEAIVQECFVHAVEPEDKGNLLRLRSGNHWLRGNFSEALKDTLLALRILGVEVNPTPTRREADIMFELVKNEILAVGFDEILAMPRTTDKRTELAVALLNEAC